MIIERVYIKSFGKLNNLNASLGSGVNIVNGKNEAGKSTFCSFLSFILYGSLGPKEDKYKYISWETGRAAGFIEIKTDDEKKYRIERDARLVYTKDGKPTLSSTCVSYDLQTNRQVFQNQVPGEVLLGVSYEIFESTIFIKQVGDNRVEGKALATSAENIIFSADEDINIDSALKQLDLIRVDLVHKKGNGGRLQELIAQRDTLNGSLYNQEVESADIIRLRNKIASDQKGIERSLEVFDKFEKTRTSVINYNLKKNMENRQQLYYEIKELEEQRDDLKTCANHANVKIYEDEFIQDLEASVVEIERNQKDNAKAEAKKVEVNTRFDTYQDKAERLKQLGGNTEGIEEFKKEVNAIHSKLIKSRLWYILSLILGVVLVVLGVVMVVLEKFDPIISYIILGVGSALVFVSFIVLTKFVNNNKNLNRVLKEKDLSNYQEFLNVISFVLNDQEQIMMIISEKEEADENYRKTHEIYINIIEKAETYLQDCGFDAKADSIVLSIQKAILEAKALKGRIESINERINDKNRNIETIDEQLKQYSDEYLKDVMTQSFDEEVYKKYSIEDINNKYVFYKQQIDRQKDYVNREQIELARLEAIYPDPTKTAEEISYLNENIDILRNRYEAVELAITALEEARGKLRDGLSPKIAESASAYLSVLSNGKYSKISVTNDFDVTYEDDGVNHNIANLSAGTTDIAYLAMRFALIENLYKFNKPPFIFDESFSRLDNVRLTNVLTLLADLTNNGLQCLIFTCHGREEAVLKKYTQYIVHNIQ